MSVLRGSGRVNTHSVSFTLNFKQQGAGTWDRGELKLILSVIHGIRGSGRVSTRSVSFTWDQGIGES